MKTNKYCPYRLDEIECPGTCSQPHPEAGHIQFCPHYPEALRQLAEIIEKRMHTDPYYYIDENYLG